MKYFLILLLFSKLISCNNVGFTTEGSDTTKVERLISSDTLQKPAEDLVGCYMKIVGRDTALLMLEQNGNSFSGKLRYDNYEKDGSSGTVRGKVDGEILKLFYDFDSEGMHSVMEVYFKMENGKLLRGIGDMDAKTDTAYFISGINYSDKESFNKVDCNLVKHKF